ncbi:M23 family metallopeptidase [Alkaliphilus pronyensis]|uniref:M23 family metallopeptidase n=1 Tax=Alkaliphilus pronyensis TaxID=1482732 RepID=A0A6I0F0R0_9FIRM|nr:M23 family metallopeptidase [Alkaliphilus pronyensis]KAB3535908.1 M23 family metallopeptidase [Alkaliphilus pronyensis]
MSLTRKDQPPIRIFNYNSSNKDIFKIDINEWIKKTLLRTVISIIILFLIFTLRLFDGRYNYGITEAIKYHVNKEFKAKEVYNTTLAWSKDILNKGAGVISVLNLTSEGKEFILPLNGQIVVGYNVIDSNTNKQLNGILLEQERGSQVVAAGDGVVIEANSSQGLGHYLIIKHKGELLSVYKYLEATRVEINQSVVKGEPIGTSSSKLLFEMWYRKESINPFDHIDTSVSDIRI